MADQGYYRNPTIHAESIAFVCEGDLWRVSCDGGLARRVTTHLADMGDSRITHSPRFSPDGRWLAFVSGEEGAPEVYVMPADGGEAQRLTWQGSRGSVVGWTRDGERVLYASNAAQPLLRVRWLWSVPRAGGAPERLPLGPAQRIDFGPGGACVLGRNIGDPATWKRYRGGTAGELWIDATGDGAFRRLLELRGNLADPLWIGSRIYFLSDHEGHGNLYSCTPGGEELARHTHHEDYYARNASSDGRRIVYQCGARLHVFDPAAAATREVEVRVASARPQQRRRFVPVEDALEEHALHPQGHSLALTARGKIFTQGNWEGAVRQHGERDGVRYRLTRWLADGERCVAVSDAGGEEALDVLSLRGDAPARRLAGLDVGLAVDLFASPQGARVALTNQRLELLLVDLETGELRRLDQSECQQISGVSWSADGRWLAYAFADSMRTAHLRIVEVASGEIHQVTSTVHTDTATCFDPRGRHLYFLSYRSFDPVPDALYFDHGFPRGARPYALVLRADLPSPFRQQPRPFAPPTSGAAQAPQPCEVRIDFDGIRERVVAFPVEEGRYQRIDASERHVFYEVWPVVGSLADGERWPEPPKPRGTLKRFDLLEQKEETLAEEVQTFHLSADRSALCYQSAKRLRVLDASAKPLEKGEEAPGRSSGWVDLARPRLSVLPAAEWRQMYGETWRLQRGNFWNAQMSGVDWLEIHQRYLPLLERVATRDELGDLLWELQGELGTSHAYEMGGDRRAAPPLTPGSLGADFAYRDGAWQIAHIVRGDGWRPGHDSPLREPGVNAEVGQRLLAIDGQALSAETPPERLLVHRADVDVELTLARGDVARSVTVRTLRSDVPARYREWVESKRAYVHLASAGEVGYLHVPDMGSHGYAEFHRYYMTEVERKGLIVDVRYNGGGNVSQLLLERLARRRIGYDVPRHGRPNPYPADSPLGPLVCLTNELAGSDGDIFSHCFKLLRLGPLIGKRTWGGVVGIWPRRALVDRTVTTQAEFAFWFEDVGFAVENYGTDPDIEVDICPQDWKAGVDPQLKRALEVIRSEIEKRSPALPDFGPPPGLAPPRLP